MDCSKMVTLGTTKTNVILNQSRPSQKKLNIIFQNSIAD